MTGEKRRLRVRRECRRKRPYGDSHIGVGKVEWTTRGPDDREPAGRSVPRTRRHRRHNSRVTFIEDVTESANRSATSTERSNVNLARR